MRTGFFRIKSTKTKAKAKGNVIKQLLLIVTTLCFLISSTAQATTYYFHNDHLGTPQVLTDENQQVVWQGAYDPFGHATEVVSEVEQNLRFPGQYLDRGMGLHYNYFRLYDPSIGRYVSADPIGVLYNYALLNIESDRLYKNIVSADRDNELNNLYGYVEQNPLNRVDIYGLGSQGTPGNNQAQNKQVTDICRELKLNRSQRRTLHDHISGDNLGYHDIRSIAIELFGLPRSR